MFNESCEFVFIKITQKNICEILKRLTKINLEMFLYVLSEGYDVRINLGLNFWLPACEKQSFVAF